MDLKQLCCMVALILFVGRIAAQSTTPHVPDAPSRIQVPEQWVTGNLLDVVQPQYPEQAKRQHIGGKVVIRIAIDKEGLVKEAAPVQGNSMLSDSAVAAVKNWKFRPYVRDNQKVEVESTVTLEYVSDTSEVRTPKPFRGPLKIRVSSGVAEGIVLRKVKPIYPEEARKKKLKGDVILQIIIDTKGNVSHVSPIEGDPMLAQAAMDAVRQWKYRPYLLNGEPLEVETQVKIKFRR